MLKKRKKEAKKKTITVSTTNPECGLFERVTTRGSCLDDARYTPINQKMYKAQKETIERVFADAKEKHGLRYTRYTGLAQVTDWGTLTFCCHESKKVCQVEMERETAENSV